MQRQEIKLPDMGEGVESATVVSVLVEVGDEIQPDQGIVELETDKAVAEVPSPAGGRVAEIHVQPDQEIKIGQLLLTLESSPASSGQAKAETQGEAEGQAKGETDKKTAATPAPPAPSAPPASAGKSKVAAGSTPADKAAQAPKGAQRPQADTPRQSEAPKAQAPAEQAPVDEASAPSKPAAGKPASEAAAPFRRQAEVRMEPPGRKTAAPLGAAPTTSAAAAKAAPHIHKLAGELGVDLTGVAGTGEGGWITEDDVKAAARRAAGTDAEGLQSDRWGVVRRERMSGIRRAIAEKMRQSRDSTVLCTNFDEADVTELDAFRRQHKAQFQAEGIELGMLPLVLRAVVNALKGHPALNASLDFEAGEIVYKHYINLGVAVDTERGLVVPVLRRVEAMSVVDIARALPPLIERVRAGQFTAEDLRGGTFTLSNLGSIGGTHSTPIINTPESAILLTGRAAEAPAVREGKLVVRRLMPLSLSYDHQIIDGAEAARFLNDLKGYLEAPARLLTR